ncbi:hypothetical protein ACFLUH_03865 [Chloroflexota bacterium]
MNNTVVLSVGDKVYLGFSKGTIYYAGMPSEKTYSIVQRIREFPYQGFAWNLFYPKEQNRIRIGGVNIVVDNVTPEEIRLRV